MNRSFWFWIGWFVFLLLVDFIVPFTLLARVASVKGSFLFWLIWAGVAVFSMFMMFLRWHDNEPATERGQA